VKLGRAQESVELFRKAAELMPEKVEPQYWLGRTLIKLGKTAEGQKILSKVREGHSLKQESEQKTLGGQSQLPADKRQ
jgi:predicted Zn-dependent protease